MPGIAQPSPETLAQLMKEAASHARLKADG